MKTMLSSPVCIGVTGGIGSGKSFVCKLLEERGLSVFYCDDEAKAEMRENSVIHRELVDLIGPSVTDADGRLVKAVLSDYICADVANAARVNAIVHPRVRGRFVRWKENKGAERVVVMECALMFEAGFDALCDKTVLVDAPLEVRIERICRRDGIDRSHALEWIGLQMSREEKLRRSDHVIVNDGISDLSIQINRIFKTII